MSSSPPPLSADSLRFALAPITMTQSVTIYKSKASSKATRSKKPAASSKLPIVITGFLSPLTLWLNCWTTNY